jgi:hypothetical protein
MFSKILKFTLGISLLNICLAADVCVKEGKNVGVYPKAPQCCKGLELQPPAAGILGTAGKCVKKCVEHNGKVGVYPGAAQCCEGLKLIPPAKGILGSAGTCKKQCVEEGGKVIVYPNALKCCAGLELQKPEPGVMGIQGTCVESAHPSHPSVNSSRIQGKDSNYRTDTLAPKKESNANQE